MRKEVYTRIYGLLMFQLLNHSNPSLPFPCEKAYKYFFVFNRVAEVILEAVVLMEKMAHVYVI